MASQMMVPYSDDTLFIRGFSARLNNDEIRNFFIKNGGNCTVEFFKQSENRDRLFIALKFDSKDIAKEVISRYDKAEVLGDRVQISWYKDLRRARNKDGNYGRRGWSPDHHGRMYSGPGRYGGYNRNYQGGSGRWRPQQRSRKYTRSSSRSPGRRYSRSRSRSNSSDRRYRSDSRDSRSASSSPERSPSFSPARAPRSPEQADNDVSPQRGSLAQEIQKNRSRAEKRHSKKNTKNNELSDNEGVEDNSETKKESSSKSERKSQHKSRRSREQTYKEIQRHEDVESDSQNDIHSPPKSTASKIMRSTVVPVEREAERMEPESPVGRRLAAPKQRRSMEKVKGELSAVDEEFFIGNHGGQSAVSEGQEKERRRLKAVVPQREASPEQQGAQLYDDDVMDEIDRMDKTRAIVPVGKGIEKRRLREPLSPDEYRVVRSSGARAMESRRREQYEDDIADYPASPPAVPPPQPDKQFLPAKEDRSYERRESRFDDGSVSGRSMEEGSMRSLPRSIPPPGRAAPTPEITHSPLSSERTRSPQSTARRPSPVRRSTERNLSPGRSPSPVAVPQRRRRGFVEDNSVYVRDEGVRRNREVAGAAASEDVPAPSKRRKQWDDEVISSQRLDDQETYDDRRIDPRRPVSYPQIDRAPQRPTATSFNGGIREAEKGALGLPSEKLLLVREKKEEIEKTYKQDCETFAAVTKMLVSKDLSLEEKIQSALRDNLKDIGQRCIHELRDFIEQLRTQNHVII